MTPVEAVARALCEQHIRIVRRHDTDPNELEKHLPEAVDYSWQGHIDQAKAAITALADNATDEMVEAGRTAWLESASDYTMLDVSIRAAITAALRSAGDA